jgi:hypothetical protein
MFLHEFDFILYHSNMFYCAETKLDIAILNCARKLI